MSGQLIGGVVGAVIGYFTPIGPYYGYMIGSAIGGYVAPGSLPDITQVGPRLSDLRPQSSEYGRPIPIKYGTVAMSGNVIWQSDIVEVATTSESETGGKSSTPTQSSSQTTFAYYGNFAVALCEGPGLITRLWAGPEKRLIYDSRSPTGNVIESGEIRNYNGDETQLPDSLIEAYEGAGNVSGHRSTVYAVFDTIALFKDGNRLPFITAEIASEWEMNYPALVDYGNRGHIAAYDSNTGYLWSSYVTSGGVMTVYVTNFVTDTLVATITTAAGSTYDGTGMCCCTNGGTVWIPRENGDPAVEIFSASGMVRINTITGGSWYGLLRYDKYKGRVWRCRTNLSESIIQYDEDGASVTGTTTLNGSDLYAISDVVFLSDKMTAAVLVHNHVVFLSSDTMEESERIPHAGQANAASRLDRMGYDVKRQRLLITTSYLGDDFIVVDIPTRTTSLHTVAGGGGCCAVRWIERSDRYVAVMSFQSDVFHIINPDTYVEEDAYPPESGNFYTLSGDWITTAPGSAYMVFALNGTPATVFKIPVAKIPEVSLVSLQSVVEDICARAGLEASQYDASELSGTMIDGYVVAKQTSCRAALEPLQQAYYFDAIESDGVIVFKPRGANVMLDIPEDELAAHVAGENPGEPLDVVRRMENELPRAISVNYMLEATDYSVSTKISQRLIGSSGDRVGIELPMVLSDQKAQEVGEVNLYSAWLQRLGYSFSTWKKYAALEPSDVIRTKGRIMRITDITETPNGILKCSAVSEDPSCYDPYVIVTPTPASGKTIAGEVVTQSIMMDIAMVRDADDDAGFYWAAAGYSDGWKGASLFKSIDGGANYSIVSSTTTPATIGVATTVLGTFLGGNIFDETNFVTVSLTGAATLSSTTELAVLNGANAALIGDEIIQFKTATLNADGTYTLFGLLRCRRGTDWAMTTHALGERFVLADVATWRRVAMDSSEIGLERLYKAVSLGSTVQKSATIQFTNYAVGLECYSPVHIGGGRNAAGDITINWTRRTRVDGFLRDYVDASLGEVSEAYEVEIYSSSSYVTLKRTITGITSDTAPYSSANQVSDFGGNQSTVYLKVFQMSATVGRGFEARGTV